MTLTPCSSAVRMVEMDSVSSVPPHIHPPMAQVPSATGDTLSAVPGMVASSAAIPGVSTWLAMVFTPCSERDVARSSSRKPWLDARFLGSDQAEGRPVEIGIAAGDSGDETISHDAHGGHRGSCVLGFGKRQSDVLERQGQSEARRVALSDDPVAVDPMGAPTKHRVGEEVDEKLRVEPALAEQGDGFAEHLQRRDHHHVPEQLDEIGLRWIGADNEGLLSEIAEERPAALDIGRNPGHNDEQLACRGGIRISEHRCGDVTLPVTRMLLRKMGRSGCADRAHRKMNCAGLQSDGEPFNTGARSPKRDVEDGVVVRQHADDELAVE